MTVMQDEDPALPEVSESEAWYDAEIAPALAALANRCNERGMAFFAAVEYQPGDHAGTYIVGADACLQMHMLSLCSRTAPNVDSYIVYDYSVSYAGIRNLKLTLGVKNLFDTAPPSRAT